VCGGAGFLGSHIVTELVSAQAAVTVLDPCIPKTGGNPKRLAHLANAIEWIRRPVEDNPILVEAVSESEFIFDAMGLSKHHMGIADPEFDLRCNYQSHLHLITTINRFARPVIYLGSRCQFGKLDGLVDEESPQTPLDPQGIHKTAAESLYRIYAERYGWPVLSIRLGNCFGPGQPVEGNDLGLVGEFIRVLQKGHCVSLYGDEKRQRNLLYVIDGAKWIVQAAYRIIDGFNAINMFGARVGLTDLLDLLVSKIGSGSYVVEPFPPEIKAIESGACDVSQDLFNQYVPESSPTPISQAIAETLLWMEKKNP